MHRKRSEEKNLLGTANKFPKYKKMTMLSVTMNHFHSPFWLCPHFSVWKKIKGTGEKLKSMPQMEHFRRKENHVAFRHLILVSCKMHSLLPTPTECLYCSSTVWGTAVTPCNFLQLFYTPIMMWSTMTTSPPPTSFPIQFPSIPLHVRQGRRSIVLNWNSHQP